MIKMRSMAIFRALAVYSSLYLLGTPSVRGTVDVALHRAGFNYYVDTNVSGTIYNTLVDTGNPHFVVVSNYTRGVNETDPAVIDYSSYCVTLGEDRTYAGFIATDANGQTRCEMRSGYAILDSVRTSINYTVAKTIDVDNGLLHNWTAVSGDMGLSYCLSSDSCSLTSFQKIVLEAIGETASSSLISAGSSILNSTKNILFGLDMNGDSEQGSSMQLGFTKSDYAANMIYTRQPTEEPNYHSFFVENLHFCGINMYSNWSSYWPAIVDTGSVCVTLPAEIYDSYAAWLNTSYSGTERLPALTFQVTSKGRVESFAIPLEHLRVPTSVMKNETYLPLDKGEDSVCILRGGHIQHLNNYEFATPHLVIGTLALKSMYITGDFSTGSVGITTKLNATENSYYQSTASHAYCAAPVQCIGQQRYEYQSNTCRPPPCSGYFFVVLDEETQVCHYNKSEMVGGLIFIFLIILAEVVSYFIGQHTTAEMLRDEESNALRDGRLAVNVKVDPISDMIGKYLTSVMDFFLIRLLASARRASAERQRQHEHEQAQAQPR